MRAGLVVTGIIARRAASRRRVTLSREQDAGSALRAMRSLLEDDDENVAERGEAQGIISGGWEEVSTALGIDGSAAVRRLDVFDGSDGAEETLWLGTLPSGSVVLRSTEDEDRLALTRSALEASVVSSRERDDLLAEVLTGGFPKA